MTDPSLIALKREQLCQLLDLELLATRTEKINCCSLSHPVCGTLFWQPQQTNTNTQHKFFILEFRNLQNVFPTSLLSLFFSYSFLITRSSGKTILLFLHLAQPTTSCIPLLKFCPLAQISACGLSFRLYLKCHMLHKDCPGSPTWKLSEGFQIWV